MTSDRLTVNQKSALRLLDFLKEVANQPERFAGDEELKRSLNSQGALAKFSSNERGIAGNSINTLKRACEGVLLNGFEELDGLRLKAKIRLSALQSRKTRAYGTVASLNEKIAALERSEQGLRQDLMLCTKVIGLALSQGRRYAELAGKDVAARCRREQRELLAYLATRSVEPDGSVGEGS